jgi:2'-hydroxyisoflavone reductase
MRLLVVGGTRFVGRHLAEVALVRGHEVTVLHRGGTGPCEVLPGAEHLHADRDGDLAVLSGRSWDATADVCAYYPEQVRSLAAALGGRGGHHAFVSTVSVYAPPPGPGLREDADLLPPAPEGTSAITDGSYGPLKVACEREAAAAHPSLLTIRPTYVVGPYDHTLRFPAWVARAARGGELLVPGPADSPMQVIDARDQAAFVVDLLERGQTGTFHTAGPPPPFTFPELVAAVVAAVGPDGTTLTVVDEHAVEAAGLGPAELPLWAGGDDDADVLAADPSAAVAAGLRYRPLAETARDTLAWLRSTGQDEGLGLDPEREAAVLAAWHAEHG